MTTGTRFPLHVSPEAAPAEAFAGAVRPLDKSIGVYRLELGALTFDVDASLGGRIVRFALDDRDVLTGRDVHPDNFGSTFWTSPQSAWGWPPPSEIDRDPYTAHVSGSTLVLEGKPCESLGVAITKSFRIDAERQAVLIEYGIRNIGKDVIRAAPWEVTRVPTEGLTFYPTGNGAHCPDGIVPLRTLARGGITWFRYDAASITTDQKWFADGSRGWLAHLAGDLLFVKSFDDIGLDAAAPGEGEIEIFADGGHRYVELEQQGAYVEIAPDQTARWRVAWHLRKIAPPHADRAPVEHDEDLVSLVERTIRR